MRLRTINNFLSVVAALLALYILAMPLVPAIDWWIKYQAPVISRAPTATVPKVGTSQAPKGNELIIPSMGLVKTINEGPYANTLSKGVWHIPGTSSPASGSNTVLAGHRYTYSGSGVLYELDKVKVGDPITLFWQGKRYDYKVSKIVIVPPTDGSVQAPTKDARLTVYSCTPLWTFTDRLVVEANLEKTS